MSDHPITDTQQAANTTPSTSSSLRPQIPLLHTLTQPPVISNPPLHRLQKDLLILTSFPENSTLHWRPSWFPTSPHATAEKFWTLHNPPNVVTEHLPAPEGVTPRYTRRLRIASDPPPAYIKTWEAWKRVCNAQGVPSDWLSESKIGLLRLGLPRNEHGVVIAPPSAPLYPEPPSRFQTAYILDPDCYPLLPRVLQPGKSSNLLVVVHPSGKIMLEEMEKCYSHASQWTRIKGTG
ncbi:hypothetical protein M011DRAFT_380824, partial [Sporormia fimetaria CBS 119925]